MNPKKLNSIIPGRLSSVKVVDGNVEMALKVWKKMLKENETVEGLYSKKYYQKPSVQKRLQLNTAKYLQSKKENNETN